VAKVSEEVVVSFTNLGNFCYTGTYEFVIQGGSMPRDDNGNRIVQSDE
jgi:hypothetical protein